MRFTERPSWKEWSFASGMALLAFGVRLLPWRKVFFEGQVHFAQLDAYYHLRRVLLILRGFPRMPGLDRYMAFPQGGECPWPPLYDLAVAALSYLIGGGSPSARDVHLVAAFLPPVLAGLTVFPLYLLARRLGGPAAAAAAPFFLLAWPGHLELSVVASGDHHAAELLLLATCILFYLRSTDEPGAASRRDAVLSGVALGAAILVWQGAIVFAAVLAGGVVLRRCLSPRGCDGPFRALFLVLGVSLALTAAGRLLWVSETPQTVFDFGTFSWFQPLSVALVLASSFILHRLLRKPAGPEGERSVARALALGLACVIVPLGVACLFPGFRSNLAEGLRFMMTGNPFLEDIDELRSPLARGLFAGPFSGRHLLDGLGLLGFLLPPAAALALLSREARRGALTVDAALFAFWTLSFAFLAIRQWRWGNAYAANAAVGFGLLLAWFRSRAGERLPRAGAAAATLSLGAVLLLPYLATVREYAAAPERVAPVQYDESMTWLRDRTPRTSGLWDLREKPEYAVFCHWAEGHLIQYYGERPTIASNFGDQLRDGGLEEMLRVYFSPDERSVAAVCERRGVRYLFLTDIYPVMGNLSRLIGIDFEREFVRGGAPSGAYTALPYARMYYFDGSEGPSGPAVSRFRMVYESPAPVRRSRWQPEGLGSPVRIYEFVRGAVVRGRTGPGGKVTLVCRLRSNTGREFAWSSTVSAGPGGEFAAVFPYATEGGPPSVAATGASVSAGGRTVPLRVREEDVRNGGTVQLPADALS